MIRPLAFLISLGLYSAAPAPAGDDHHHGANHNQLDSVRVDLHGNLDSYSVFGAGGRIEFAVVPDGFIGGNGWSDKHGRSYGWIYAQPDLGIGARYHFNDNVALLMRLSTPGGLQVGVVF